MLNPHLNAIKAIAIAAHEAVGQKRKNTDVPYYTHPVRVAELVKENGGTDVQIAAGYLHDVVEDTALTLETLSTVLVATGLGGKDVEEVVDLTRALTDKFTPQKGLNRKWRIAADIVRHRDDPNGAFWLVKHCDVFDNLRSIETEDKNFLPIFLTETFTLFDATPKAYRETPVYRDLRKLYNTYDETLHFKTHHKTKLLSRYVKLISECLPRDFGIRELILLAKNEALNYAD